MPGQPWLNYSPFNPATWTIAAQNTGYPASRLATFIIQATLAAIGAAGFLAIILYILAIRVGRGRVLLRPATIAGA